MKILFLILLGIYIVFAIIVYNRTTSLGRIVLVDAGSATKILNILTLLHVLVAVLLFLIGIVIL